MATTAERELFEIGVLSPVVQQAERLRTPEVTGFLAMSGQAYDGGLMVIGRAVNGWTDGISPKDLSLPTNITKYAALVQESVAGGGECPMSWVTSSWGAAEGYNPAHSAFWRCVRNITKDLNIVDSECANWSSHLVWSNLYKLSPAEGGNPNDRLCDAQRQGCLELFKLELRTYRPSRVLFLTGMDWANPFVAGAQLQNNEDFMLVERYGRIRLEDGADVQCVVAVHPQGKPEADWVREVLAAFDAQ